MLFAIPAGLALVALGEQSLQGLKDREPGTGKPAGFTFLRSFGFPVLVLSVAALLLVPADGPGYNRLWHVLSVTPRDLQAAPVVSAAESAEVRLRGARPTRLVATAAAACVFNAALPCRFPYCDRTIGQPLAGSAGNAVAVILSNRPTFHPERPTLNPDPSAAEPRAWTTIDGSPPEFVGGMTDFRASPTALQNPRGRRSDVFSSKAIPIDPTQRYVIEMSAIQRSGTGATAYLGVAWYDAAGRLLVSNLPAPAGAGNPSGWANGIRSYFGLVGQAVPGAWTTYRSSFGPGEAATLPPEARYIRVGALLNYDTAPDEIVQVTNIRLWRKSEAEPVADGAFPFDERLLVFAPSGRMLWTSASLAGQLSTHWPRQEAAADLTAGEELAAAVLTAGGRAVDPDGTLFELEGYAGARQSER
jgi:hypothetical protein